MSTTSQQSESTESFEDLVTSGGKADEVELPSQDDWSTPVSGSVKSKADNQVERLEANNEETDAKSSSKSKAKEAEESEDEDEDIEPEEQKGDKGEKGKDLVDVEVKPLGKLIKARLGDSDVEVDTGMIIRQKVDGKMKEFTLQELMNQKAGEVSYDKKFNELSQKTKEVESQRQQFESEKRELKHHIQKVVDMAKSHEGHPLEAMYYLLEMSGQNPIEFEKRAMASLMDDYERYLDMSEVEREAHWLRKEKGYSEQRENRKFEESKAHQSREMEISRVEELLDARGVDTEAWSKAFAELQSHGWTVEQLKQKPEVAVEYARQMPHIPTAKSMLENYKNEMDDADYANVLKFIVETLADSSESKTELENMLKAQFGVSEEVKELNQKAKSSTPSKPAKRTYAKSEETYESWSDLNM